MNKIDHLLIDYYNNDEWFDELADICKKCLQDYGDIVYLSRFIQNDLWHLLVESERGKNVKLLKDLVKTVRNIRDEWSDYGFYLTIGDYERIKAVINTNGLKHTKEKKGIIENNKSKKDGELVLLFKVSVYPMDCDSEIEDLVKIKDCFEKPYSAEHLSELREIVCDYYGGTVEVISSKRIQIGQGSYNGVRATSKDVTYLGEDSNILGNGTHYRIQIPIS